MNTVSWFLYGADVINNLAVVLIISLILFGGALAAMIIIRAIYNDDQTNGRTDPKWLPYTPILKKFIWVLLGALLVAIIPAKQTLYMIAASEVGEVVVNTPEAKELLNETRNAILRQVQSIGTKEEK